MSRPRKTQPPRFVASEEVARIEELHRYGILDTARDPVFDDLTRLAAEVCNAPMALISLVDRDRHWFKSVVDVRVMEIPRDGTFCDHTILQEEILVVTDTERDNRFKHNPFVQGEPFVRFYAGATLRTGNGHALGALCVMDRRPRRLSGRQRDALLALSRQVVAQMELKRTIHELRMTAIEHHVAQTALRKSEERFREFMNGGPALAYIKDAAGRYVYVNEATARRFSRPAAEWVGKSDVDIVGEVNADSIIEHDLAVLDHERPVVVEEAVPTPDGSAQHWLSYKFLLHDDTGQKQLGGFSFDITERKAAENERERLVEELREALAQVKTLSGFLPICASCKNIRDDAGYWQGIESYLCEHSDVEFTHGICPECVAKLYPEFAARQREGDRPSRGGA